MKIRITSREAALECVEVLNTALRAMERLDTEEGPRTQEAPWPWLRRHDELSSADLSVVRHIAGQLSALLLTAHRQVRSAEERGCEMSGDPIRALGRNLSAWCREAAAPGARAKDTALHGIAFLFRGDKEVKRIGAELRAHIGSIKHAYHLRDGPTRPRLMLVGPIDDSTSAGPQPYLRNPAPAVRRGTRAGARGSRASPLDTRKS